MNEFIVGYREDDYLEIDNDFPTYEDALKYCEERAKDNGRDYYILAPIARIGRPNTTEVEEYEYV